MVVAQPTARAGMDVCGELFGTGSWFHRGTEQLLKIADPRLKPTIASGSERLAPAGQLARWSPQLCHWLC